MEKVNQIGIERSVSNTITDDMNHLLSSFQIYYQNLRGFHWNITGKVFFELHLKFEEMYSDALLKVDEIAERILTLGNTPVHSFSRYIELSSIKEIKDCHNGDEAIQHILEQIGVLLALERNILKKAAEHSDEGTAALMSGYIQAQEKQIWMFNAWSK